MSRAVSGGRRRETTQLRCDGGAGGHLEPVAVRSPPGQHGLGHPEFGGLFANLERKSNPWGLPPKSRPEWTKGLDVPVPIVGRDIDIVEDHDPALALMKLLIPTYRRT